MNVETSEGIFTITINRPEALNALNRSLLSELNSVLDNVPTGVGAVIITGAGKAFVAGADISEMAIMTPKQAEEFAKLGQNVFSKIANLPVPAIAAVNGYALGGGCELALACDIRIASEKAKFGQPEVGLGITPGFGATQRLPRIVGEAKAKELIFTGAIIDANEAFRIGLANKVVPLESLIAESRLVAKTIMEKGPIAIAKSKCAINEGANASLQAGMEIEARLFGECFGPEQKEGMKAFSEKRKPAFKRQ
ncbi:MAG: enoyl-CoA hydratase-related protein [Candidatus Thermoplasmatota archaeon]|nr:enoyl-CoA hydratase-related protein [Candidatus Thermoplasmatota archaeon]